MHATLLEPIAGPTLAVSRSRLGFPAFRGGAYYESPKRHDDTLTFLEWVLRLLDTYRHFHLNAQIENSPISSYPSAALTVIQTEPRRIHPMLSLALV